nr:DUF4097 family beta strand repeat-containing protein [Actinoalloteichus hoggarensis]
MDVGAGNVTVRASDRPGITVTLSPMSPGDEVAAGLIYRADARWDGGVVRISVPRPTGGGVVTGMTVINGRIVGAQMANGHVFGGAVSVLVEVPTGTAISVTTESADVRTLGTVSEAWVWTVSGDVAVDTVSSLVAQTVSGDVRSSVGPTLVDRARVKTTSGDVDLRASGPASVSTVSGDVRLHGTGPSADLTARTVSGDITISADPSARIAPIARTVSGRVRTPAVQGRGW